MRTSHFTRKAVLIFILLIIGGFIYFSYDPTSSALFPKCPVFVMTGLKCTGCGSQRVVHALLHFDVITALKHNALLVLSLPFIIMLIYAEIVRETKPSLYRKVNNRRTILTSLVIIILWTIFRNIFDI